MSADDDRLLEALGAALAPPSLEPTPAEMAAFHRVLAGEADEVATVTPIRRRSAPVAWRLALAGAAAAVLLVAVVASQGGQPSTPPAAPGPTTSVATATSTTVAPTTTTTVGPVTTTTIPVAPPVSVDDKGGGHDDRSGSNSGSG